MPLRNGKPIYDAGHSASWSPCTRQRGLTGRPEAGGLHQPRASSGFPECRSRPRPALGYQFASRVDHKHRASAKPQTTPAVKTDAKVIAHLLEETTRGPEKRKHGGATPGFPA